jgi:curved DNA-binding protein CbpA
MSQSKDYYSVLGVLSSAEIIVIRAAYRALAQKYHPDKWRGDKTEGDRRMREINDAYEVLSNEVKRKAYDSERQQNNDNIFDFEDDTIRSAFGDAEAAQDPDWAVAIEYYPDLSEIYRRLKRISDKLAFAYRSTILESKEFKRRLDIAEQMEKQFLARYFGDNPQLIRFAKALIKVGNRSAAKGLNLAISVLGKQADAELIMRRIQHKFNIETEREENETIWLARKVIETKHFEDANRLVDRLETKTSPNNKDEFVLQLNDENRPFQHEYNLTWWVILNVAYKIVNSADES